MANEGSGGAGGVAIVAIVVLVLVGVLGGGYLVMHSGSAPHSISGSVSTPAGPISGNAITH